MSVNIYTITTRSSQPVFITGSDGVTSAVMNSVPVALTNTQYAQAIASFGQANVVLAGSSQPSTQQITATAPGNYALKTNLSSMLWNGGIGIIVTVNGSNANYTVQISGDSQALAAPVNLNPHDTLGTSQTASSNGNIEYAVTWIVLSVTSITGNIVMSIIQPTL